MRSDIGDYFTHG